MLYNEKHQLEQKLKECANAKQRQKSTESRLDQIYELLDGLKDHHMDFDDYLVRQLLECVVVESKNRIKVVFVGGLEVTEDIC